MAANNSGNELPETDEEDDLHSGILLHFSDDDDILFELVPEEDLQDPLDLIPVPLPSSSIKDEVEEPTEAPEPPGLGPSPPVIDLPPAEGITQTFRDRKRTRERSPTSEIEEGQFPKRARYEEEQSVEDTMPKEEEAPDMMELPTTSKEALRLSEALAKSKQSTAEEDRPEKSIILSVEELVPPKPRQSQLVDFEEEISKEQLKPGTPGQTSSNPTPETGWQSSFRAHLEVIQDTTSGDMTEVTDPEAMKLRSIGSSAPYQSPKRPWAPPSPRGDLSLSVGTKRSKMFCTLQLNQALSLETVASSLNNPVYNSDIGVVQKRYIATQIAWIWADGTVMIINGSSQAMLENTQTALMARIIGKDNYQAHPSHNLQIRRHISYVEFPWQIDMLEFSETCSLSSRLLLNEMHYVYYVDKDLPGVAARVHGTGMIQVFAMSPEQTDQMLSKLYLLTGNYKTKVR